MHRNIRTMKHKLALAVLATGLTCGLSLSVGVSATELASNGFNVASLGAGSIAARHVPAAVANGQAPLMAKLSGDQHVKLGLNLPLRNQADLDTLLEQLQDPQSPNFHQYLSGEEFTAKFGPTEEDYNQVVAWANANGLTVTETTPNRRLVSVEGKTQDINRALHVTMNTYQHPTEDRTFFSADREPVASTLSVPLLKVTGLDNYVRPFNHLKSNPTRAAQILPHITGSGPSNQYLPSDMRAAYYGSGSLTGAGQSIAIFSYDGYLSSDVTKFYTSTGMTSSVPINNVLVGGYSGVCDDGTGSGTGTCNDGEQILDIVNAIGMAPGISQIQFYEGSSGVAILNKMATDNTSKVLSCSWGGGDFSRASDDPIFQQMAAQGQTFLNATGDSGAYNSSTWLPPSEDSYVLEVGGTDLLTNGAGGSWASETGWATSGGGFYSASGATIPAYQQLAGVITSTNKGSTTYRNDPDISAEADFDNPTVSNGSFLTGYGGTSFAAPRIAGFIALANQQSVANGTGTLGFVNTKLYNIGLSTSYSTTFHDITSGNNKPSTGAGAGFNAVAGYDLVTGWGSPNGANLIAALVGGTTPTPNFTLSDAPGSASVTQGGSATSTISVTDSGGFTGSVALTASGLPSGVTASFSPASTTSASTLTLTASASATTGPATITITGTSGSLSHTTSLALTVNAASGGGNVLTNNVAVTGLSGATGVLSADYTFTVPAGATAATVAISGGTGDADMYVQVGAAPTLTSYSCRPYVTGNAESCTLTAGNTYHIKINAYAAYTGVSLVGKYTASGGGGGNVLSNNVAVTGLSGATGVLSADYTFTVPAGATAATVAISGGTGDADMYVQVGVAPTLTSYSCRPYVTGNAESCTLTAGNTYHIKLNAYAAYSGVSLLGTYTP